ncbi:hypothetical protein JHK87_048513 [Glycine soja]|nr:hypothetical protein JHK87_048513 [Glycine soja]
MNPKGNTLRPASIIQLVLDVLLLPVFSVGGWLVRRGPWLLLWCFCLLRGCCSFGLLDRLRDRYSSNYSVSEYHVYEFCKIWNCSRDEADIRVHEFFKTAYFKSGIHPLPGAQMTLQKLSRFCSLSVVTYAFGIDLSSYCKRILSALTNWRYYCIIRSRQNAIKDHIIEWLEKNYPGLFHDIHFGNHFALDGVSRPKSEICRSLNAKVLIDDNPRYAIECADVGIRVLLFDYENSYPWCKNESADQHPLVTRVKNWEEVERQLMSLIAS